MFTGPNIVEEGLVLALDAANIKSFRGEPTTNAASTDTARTFFKHDSASVMTFSDAPEKGEGWKKIIITERSANNFRRAQFPYISHPDGVTRTYSLEYDVGNLTGYGLRVDGTSGYSTTAISGQGKYTITITPSGTKTAAVFLTHGSGLTTGLNDIIYYRYYQVENKSTATRFTTGTRGTTVANGGGWADISGNDNHGEILNGTSTSNDGSVLGALDFDGTNDYIDIDESITLGSEWSVEAWIYLINGNDYTHIFSSQTAQTEFTCKIAETSDDRKPYFYKSGVINTFSGTSRGLNLNTWHHLVYTYDGSTIKIYIDTEEVRSVSATMNIGSDTYSIGDSGNTNEFGTFRLSKHTVRTKNLTTSEVLQNYNATKSRFGL